MSNIEQLREELVELYQLNGCHPNISLLPAADQYSNFEFIKVSNGTYYDEQISRDIERDSK